MLCPSSLLLCAGIACYFIFFIFQKNLPFKPVLTGFVVLHLTQHCLGNEAVSESENRIYPLLNQLEVFKSYFFSKLRTLSDQVHS